jgi:hypothetical protein
MQIMLHIAWYNNNTANEGRRVVLTSIAVPLANLMGVVSSNMMIPTPPNDAVVINAGKYLGASCVRKMFELTTPIKKMLPSTFLH